MDKAFQWVAPPLLNVVTPEPQAAAPAPAWQQYVGKYRRAWGDWQVLLLNGELVMIDPSLLDPLPTLNKLIPVAAHTFRIATKNASGANGELVIFDMDSQGKIPQVKMGENDLSPQAEW